MIVRAEESARAAMVRVLVGCILPVVVMVVVGVDFASSDGRGVEGDNIGKIVGIVFGLKFVCLVWLCLVRVMRWDGRRSDLDSDAMGLYLHPVAIPRSKSSI